MTTRFLCPWLRETEKDILCPSKQIPSRKDGRKYMDMKTWVASKGLQQACKYIGKDPETNIPKLMELWISSLGIPTSPSGMRSAR